jgi:hypothetical protein
MTQDEAMSALGEGRAAASGREVNRRRRMPLAGVRILDFGQIILLPFATRWLAWMGAEVILI